MKQKDKYAFEVQDLFLKWIRVDDIDIIRNLIEESGEEEEESSHKTIIKRIINITKVFQWA